MARVKRGVMHTKKRNNILKAAKGFSRGRNNLIRQATQAVKKAGQRAFDHRKLKKRQFRAVWQIKIGAAAKLNGTNYSKLIGAMKKANVTVDRKVLSQIAEHHPEVFAGVVKQVMS
jgi:large subunit ribosomal protein L20